MKKVFVNCTMCGKVLLDCENAFCSNCLKKVKEEVNEYEYAKI